MKKQLLFCSCKKLMLPLKNSTPTLPQCFLSQEQMLDDFCTVNGEIQHEITSAVPSSSQTLEQTLYGKYFQQPEVILIAEGKGSTLQASAIQSSWMHGTALAMTRNPVIQNGNGMRAEEPYLDIGKYLPSPNLRFRKHLKSAIHPALQQRTLSMI